MDRRRSRLLALTVSTLVAAAILAIAWPRLMNRARESVQFHQLERPVADASPRSPQPIADDESSSDPIEPRNWRYYLTEEQANRYFGFRGDVRYAYDPWVYVRDAGNLNDDFPMPEHPHHKWTWKTNSLGCREDHELDDPPRNLRVLVAGDSHTCGVCSDNESFANRLESKLALEHTGKTVEVLNTGLGGYSFYNYYGTLLRFRSFKPQVFVVAVFGGNDFTELLTLDYQFAGRAWDSMTPPQQERRNAALAISSDAMGQGLNSIDTFRAWPHEQPLMVRAAIEMCAQMRRVAERHNTKMIVVFIPSPFDFHWGQLPRAAIDTRAALALTDEDMTINRRMGEQFLDGLREANVQLLDMRPIFERESSPPYWRMDYHMNLRAHELIAVALKPLVEAALAGE